MIGSVLAKVFGTKNEREIKRIQPQIDRINALEPEIQQLSDEQLRAKTQEFKQKIQDHLEAELGADAVARTTPSKLKKGHPDTERTASEAEGQEVDAGPAFSEKYKRVLQEALDEVLPEAFAVVREAGRRVLVMRHFDVQLIGGIVLHEGNIAEMKTGEGKTLVATLPVYLNALAGLGVHVVTVNDYLAKRDSEWMGKLYSFLGLTVGVIVHDLDDNERRAAYSADITYGTNNEYGFDYLRDNMKFDMAERVQRGHHFAIVDEVDSILIDEARTPLIISGASEESTDKYFRVNRIIPKLERGEEIGFGEEKSYTGDFIVDEKHRNTVITDVGWEKVEQLLGISNIADPENWDLKHHVETAVKAHALYRKDVEYVIKDGEIIIVDEFTGRLMPGRRWSDGLHQAIEAKEGVKIERENQTLATVTFQNYFRMYNKLAGMTGTAETEAAEFDKIYKLEVIAIPPNRKLLRVENADIVFRTEKEKYFAVADEIQTMSAAERPVLVGTTSVEKSERLSELLKKKGVKHVVLNAKYHEKEAEIVAQAGRQGAITIATNMAGRGTDILLGGNPDFIAKQECVKNKLARAVHAAAGELDLEASDASMTRFYYQGNEFEISTAQWEEAYNRHKELTDAEHNKVVEIGGLHILGTERHSARRIDNQLRGRAGRQGDPGSSRFYLSLEDDLMRIFAKEWISNLLQRLGMEEGVPIESGMISRRIEAAQKAIESQDFEARKHLLEYDDVMNKQRLAVYGLRDQLLEGIDQKDLILEDYVAGMLSESLDKYIPANVHPEQWDVSAFQTQVLTKFGVDLNAEGVKIEEMTRQEIGDKVFEKLRERYNAKETLIGAEAMRYHERMIMLSVMDSQWKDHLLNMDHLKEGIGLRGYAQKDPLVEYKRESFEMFEEMMQRFQEETVRYLYLMQVVGGEGDGGNIPPRDRGPEIDGSGNGSGPSPVAGPSAPNRARQRATSIDDMEQEFQRRKRRELEQARMAGGGEVTQVQQVVRTTEKVRPNEPCPCGSGKKYKKCHGIEA
ncbi:MAG: protein translocase subunit secA [Candidatus Angelobacter sp.]|nr:protein translocase subunit secA [Candidatus Angelobacter sp.]